MQRILLAGLIGIVLGPVPAMAQGGAQPLSLEVMNPRAAIPPPPSVTPSPRVADLAGKRIGLYWIGKPGGDNFFDGLEQILKQKYPTASMVRYRGGFDLGDARSEVLKKEVDVVVYGVGD